MDWWTTLSAPFTAVIDLIKEPLKGWQERKKIKITADMEVAKLEAEAKVKTAEAKVELAKTGQMIESDWDRRAQEQMTRSWKDEVLMILLFSPVAVLFGAALLGKKLVMDRIIEAVNALNEFPYWYVVMLLGIVASVFALRWLVAPLIAKGLAAKQNETKIVR